jgi:hypothetical protein
MKGWEVVADNLKKAEFSLRWVSADSSTAEAMPTMQIERIRSARGIRAGSGK